MRGKDNVDPIYRFFELGVERACTIQRSKSLRDY